MAAPLFEHHGYGHHGSSNDPTSLEPPDCALPGSANPPHPHPSPDNLFAGVFGGMATRARRAAVAAMAPLPAGAAKRQRRTAASAGTIDDAAQKIAQLEASPVGTTRLPCSRQATPACPSRSPAARRGKRRRTGGSPSSRRTTPACPSRPPRSASGAARTGAGAPAAGPGARHSRARPAEPRVRHGLQAPRHARERPAAKPGVLGTFASPFRWTPSASLGTRSGIARAWRR